MEKRDYRANLALIVAIASALFSGWQAWTNADRYAHEKVREQEDRTPIILISASRPNAERYIALNFRFQNKEYAPVTIDSVTLTSPATANLALADRDMVASPRDGIDVPRVNGMDRQTPSKTKNLNLEIASRGTGQWWCYVIVPEADPLPAGTTANFDVKLRLRDNSDTDITVHRFVTLVQ